MKKVMVFGTFDGVHLGHENFFKQARKYGNYLIAVVARDQTVRKIKGKWPRIKENQRLNLIKENKFVNQAILGSRQNKFKVIINYQPEVICLGYDQWIAQEELREQLRKIKIKAKIFRLKAFYPDKYKSSKIVISKKS